MSFLRARLSLQLGAMACVIAIWSALHWIFRDVYVFHDTWKHNFPETYGVAQNSTCGQFAHWLMFPDTGAPTVIYSISISLTQPIRALLIHWWACTDPHPLDAMLHYKLQIFVIYLGFALGMFVLGRLLFSHWLSAVYLVAASLFAGFCVYNVHSDQGVLMMFWVPWCAAALVLADRYAGELRAALYVNLAAIFFCLQLLDQSPHLAALAAATTFFIYGGMRFERLLGLLKIWPRLWPAALVLLVTAGCLYVIQSQIYDYQPSQRAAINVHPSQFGQTGFIQPSAFFGMFFPLTFTAAFEEIASGYGWRAFIYRLDVLVLYLGTLPLIMVISLCPKGGFRGAPLGWLIFSIILILMSLQPSQLYLALFHLPFFNLFRDYFHYFVFGMTGLLVLSGYGFDRIVNSTADGRAGILRSTLILSGILFVGAGVVLCAVAFYGKGHGPGFWSYLRPMMEDAAIVIAAFVILAAAVWRPNFQTKHVLVAIATVMVTQSIHAAGIYRQLGESGASVFSRLQMDATMLSPYSVAEWAEPTRIRRVDCPTNASCFLAQRDGASLKRDLDGTFLRHGLNPVFQDGISTEVKAALVGITHPVLWASGGLQGVASVAEAARELEANRGDLAALLSRWTYLIGSNTTEDVGSVPAVTFSNMTRSANELSFHYRADRSAFANLSITAASDWSATVNGVATPVIRGNFEFIALRIPAGEGTVELRYSSRTSHFFFWSRWLLAALASGGIAWLSWRSRRGETAP